MTLVERFTEFDRWPTSRKTAFLSGLLVGAHGFATLVVDYAARQATSLLNVRLLDAIAWPWLGSILFCFLISVLVMRRGREGRWTRWLMICPYGLFLVFVIYAFGFASTALVAWLTMAILMVAMIYDVRTGCFAALYIVCLLCATLLLQSVLELPYAPALLDRTLDAQRNVWFTGAVLFVVIQTAAVCFGILLLLASSKQLYQARLERSARLIRRYIPSQLADKIIKGEHSELFKPERVKLTIFFSDIEGFTDASDQLDAEDLTAVLNEYLSEMTVIAECHGATLNQFVGDGIMIFFGAPQVTSDRDHALRAVRMALDMQTRLLELKDVWLQRGIRKPFRARIGINTGHASVGDYGSEGRKVYSAIGLQTNLAARIQAHCKPGQVLISDTTWALVKDEIACADKGELQLKGVHFPVKVYGVEVA